MEQTFLSESSFRIACIVCRHNGNAGVLTHLHGLRGGGPPRLPARLLGEVAAVQGLVGRLQFRVKWNIVAGDSYNARRAGADLLLGLGLLPHREVVGLLLHPGQVQRPRLFPGQQQSSALQQDCRMLPGEQLRLLLARLPPAPERTTEEQGPLLQCS